MKRRKRTTTVTFESERFLIFGGSPARCDMCGGSAALVGPTEAARHAGLSEPALRRAIESQAVHLSETPAGHLLICLESLAQWIQAQ
jgi:hypothetical protein